MSCHLLSPSVRAVPTAIINIPPRGEKTSISGAEGLRENVGARVLVWAVGLKKISTDRGYQDIGWWWLEHVDPPI